MTTKRLSLITYDVLRELCERCLEEAFQFVPIGTALLPASCTGCGTDRTLADMSDSSIRGLVTRSDGELRIVPLLAK